jgi:hypothetical protein
MCLRISFCILFCLQAPVCQIKVKPVIPFCAPLKFHKDFFSYSSHGTCDNFLLDKVSDMKLMKIVFGID